MPGYLVPATLSLGVLVSCWLVYAVSTRWRPRTGVSILVAVLAASCGVVAWLTGIGLIFVFGEGRTYADPAPVWSLLLIAGVLLCAIVLMVFGVATAVTGVWRAVSNRRIGRTSSGRPAS